MTQNSEPLTPDECKRIRLALAFGDPGLEGQSDPKLEVAKSKLRAIEIQGQKKKQKKNPPRAAVQRIEQSDHQMFGSGC